MNKSVFFKGKLPTYFGRLIRLRFMMSLGAVKRVEWLLGSTIFMVSVFVTPNANIDPINVPKLWALSILTFAICLVLISQSGAIFSKTNIRTILIGVALFTLMFFSMFFSNAPVAQQFFGVFGRNTGLLAYFCFSSLFIASAIVPSKKIIKPVLLGSGAAFAINAIYGVIQALKLDPLNWVNPYAPVIGTLGNPDFVSAFLGMSMAFAGAYLINKGQKLWIRVALIIYIVVASFDIYKSQAQQGAIIAVLSAGLIGYLYLQSKVNNKVILKGYLGLGVLGAFLSILGSINIGPFASILHKASVLYRGDYWRAAWVMIKQKPLFGVGLDSYGDWYRASRDATATLRRGPSVTSNAAHNVFLDIASTAGILALIAYLVVIYFGINSAIKVMKKSNDFEPFFVAIFVAWIAYLAQSAISINNLALGIWGWILPGLLISIERWTFVDSKQEKNKSGTQKTSVQKIDFSGMVLAMGLVIGGVIGYLPFNADANFRHALETGDTNKIYAAATKWPQDSSRMIYAAQIFNHNNMPDRALSLTKEIVKIFPRNFDAWIYIYNDKSTTIAEKTKILRLLKSIDPHNPDLNK